jgi:uncharacterized alpha-E superfamily protein
MMLSRIADSLFWTSRYLERAEDTSRILEVHLLQVTEDPTLDEEVAARNLLAVMGQETDDVAQGRPFDAKLVMDLLCYDPSSRGSLRAIMASAREAARSARETLSLEFWEAINTGYHEVAADSFDRLLPQAALQLVRQRCVLATGLANQTMSHDEGSHFMRLGRYLERVDMSARLISSAAATPGSQVAWSNALRACGAHHSFVRTYSGGGTDEEAASFLVLDRRFPRSLLHSLIAVEETLSQLEPPADSLPAAARLAGRTRAELEYLDPSQLRVGLGDRMERIQAICTEIGELIIERYLQRAGHTSWREEPACA